MFLSFIHLNIFLLPFHFTLTSIQLPGYNIQDTPTVCYNGGTLFYMKKRHKF